MAEAQPAGGRRALPRSRGKERQARWWAPQRPGVWLAAVGWKRAGRSVSQLTGAILIKSREGGLAEAEQAGRALRIKVGHRPQPPADIQSRRHSMPVFASAGVPGRRATTAVLIIGDVHAAHRRFPKPAKSATRVQLGAGRRVDANAATYAGPAGARAQPPEHAPFGFPDPRRREVTPPTAKARRLILAKVDRSWRHRRAWGRCWPKEEVRPTHSSGTPISCTSSLPAAAGLRLGVCGAPPKPGAGGYATEIQCGDGRDLAAHSGSDPQFGACCRILPA